MVKLIILYFMFYFTLGSSVLYFATLFNAMSITGKMSGLIFGAGSLIAMITQPLLGMLADKTRKNREILISLVLVIVFMTLLLYFFPSTLIGVLVFLMYSIAVWGIMPLMDSMSLGTGYNFGKIRLWGSIGFAAGSFASGKAISTFGEDAFLLVACIGGILTTLTLLSVENSKSKIEKTEKLNIEDIKELLGNKSYMIFILFTILVLGSNNVNNTYFSLFFEKIGGSATMFGVSVFLLTMSEVPFMNWTSKLVIKYGSRNMLIFSGLATVTRWFLYFFFPYPGTVVASFLLQGASIGVFFVVAAIHIKNIVSEKTISTAITSYMASGTLGGTLFLVLSGYIIDGFGIRALYLMFLILAALGTSIMFKDKR